MKKILVLLLIILCGCANKTDKNLENNDKNSSKKEDLVFEYAEKVYLNEISSSKKKTLIDTTKLGNNKIEVENETINYKVVDTTSPVINVSNMTTKVGHSIDFISNLMCGDNYDKNLNCEIVGDYDFNKIGTYNLKVQAKDSSGNETVKDFKLAVVEKLTYSNNKDYYDFNDLVKNYKTEKTMVGIDVSSWQDDIDFQKVKAAKAEFVMIRIGFGHKNGKNIIDSKFKQNIKNAKKAGLKVGLYFYSHAKTKDEAIDQAKWIINELNGEKLDLPIAFDWEIWNGFSKYNLNFKDLNEIADSFISEINKNGYEGIIYGSAFFVNRVWNLPCPTWLAYYTKNNDFEKPYYIWQLSSRGKIKGINGYVDLDILYK